jgi:hypothetical protein
MRLFPYLFLLLAVGAAPLSAEPKNAFDGKWQVETRSEANFKKFVLTIEWGAISGWFEAGGKGQPYRVSGRVHADGRYELECENNKWSFPGTGRLTARGGTGEAVGPSCGFTRRSCTMEWTWTKTGGPAG